MASSYSKTALGQRFYAELRARENLDALCLRGGQIISELQEIDIKDYESMPAQEAVPMLLSGPVLKVLQLIQSSQRLLHSLPSFLNIDLRIQTEQSRTPESSSQQQLPSHSIEGQPQPPYDAYCEELDALTIKVRNQAIEQTDRAMIFDVCQQAQKQLLHVQKEIRLAWQTGNKWGLITASEEAKRKSQVSLRSLLTMSLWVMEGRAIEDLLPAENSELQTALYLRRMLLTFKSNVEVILLQLDMIAIVEAQPLFKKMVDLIQELNQHQMYSRLRAKDRFQIQKFYTICKLFSDPSNMPAIAQQQLGLQQQLQAFSKYIASLASINQRQILIRHDLEAVKQLLSFIDGYLKQSLNDASSLSTKPLFVAFNQAEDLLWRSEAFAEALQAVKQQLQQKNDGTHYPSDGHQLHACLLHLQDVSREMCRQML